MLQTCTALQSRIEFVGEYSNQVCEVRIDVLTEEDLGQWSCEMESYVWGAIRGTTDKRGIEVQPTPDEETTEPVDVTSGKVKLSMPLGLVYNVITKVN